MPASLSHRMTVLKHLEKQPVSQPRATYEQIACFLANTINATRFECGDNNAITEHVRVTKAALHEHNKGVVRVDLSDGSFFFLDPEYLVPREHI